MNERTCQYRFEVDVDAIAPPGASTVVGDVFFAPDLPSPDPIVLCCLPGGGMSRRYFDIGDVVGIGNFSMARHLAARGLIVITLDHVGVGESSRPDDGFSLTPQAVADVNAHVVQTVLDGLRAGDLAPGLEPAPALVPVGVGHSAGASLTVHQQARHRTYRALCLLGFGGRGLADHLTPEELAVAHDADAIHSALPLLAAVRYPDPLPVMRRGSSQFLVGAPMHEAVRAALVACRTNLLALVGLASMIPGNITPEIESIDVPVFLGVGDRDITPPAHEIPAEFRACRDITLYVLDDAGHNHNVAPTREALWDRLAAWLSSLETP